MDWAALSHLFTILICIDRHGEIVFASETTRRYVLPLARHSRFFDVFILQRPAGVRRMEDLHDHLQSLFLMRASDDSFALRGQMLELQWQGETVLCFCGAPWVFWINANRPDVKLRMGDFPPQDSQLDQLFLMTTEQRMVSDLEKLNSDLKRAKRETERAQAAKEALFARMSHEMRTPLNGVVSALSLLADQSLSPEGQTLLKLADSSARNLLHVINYVLDISKLEAGDEVLEPTVVDLSRVLAGVSNIVRARAVEKNISLSWECSGELAESYLADRDKLRQCLLNLVTNAIKFTERGSVLLRALPGTQDDAKQVRFEVRDTGIGIDAIYRQRIFEPFWTGAGDAGEQGTGLGLDIVRRNIELMGGSLGVHSQVGEGSVFWFEVPLDVSEQQAPAEIDELVIRPLDHMRFEGKVLLVDDNRTNLLLGRKILESVGADVTCAADGAAAVRAALDGHFDLVLMDVSMPVMDGVEATLAIRKQRDAKELPVVALTAYTSSEERDRCLAAGMNDYLTKPIVRERLMERLDTWLHRAPDTATTARPDAGTAPVAEEDGTPELDTEVLETLRSQIGEANLGAVMDEFQNEIELRRTALRKALEKDDREALTREAHTLASTCRSLGLLASGEAFSALESTLRGGAEPPGGDLAAQATILERGLDALRQYRERSR